VRRRSEELAEPRPYAAERRPGGACVPRPALRQAVVYFFLPFFLDFFLSFLSFFLSFFLLIFCSLPAQ
jgi:hypothetical protein